MEYTRPRDDTQNKTKPDQQNRHKGLTEQRDIIKIQRIQTDCINKRGKKEMKKTKSKTIRLVYSISRQGGETIPSVLSPEAPEAQQRTKLSS